MSVESVPAGEIERFVVDQLRGIGTDPAFVRETLARAGERIDENVSALEAELRGLERDAGRWNDAIRGLFGEVAGREARRPCNDSPTSGADAHHRAAVPEIQCQLSPWITAGSPKTTSPPL